MKEEKPISRDKSDPISKPPAQESVASESEGSMVILVEGNQSAAVADKSDYATRDGDKTKPHKDSKNAPEVKSTAGKLPPISNRNTGKFSLDMEKDPEYEEKIPSKEAPKEDRGIAKDFTPETPRTTQKKRDKEEKNAKVDGYLDAKREKLRRFFMGEDNPKIEPKARDEEAVEALDADPEPLTMKKAESLEAEIEEIKIWDYVLSFPNPDNEGGLAAIAGEKAISFKDAKEVFHTCIKPQDTVATFLAQKIRKLEEEVFEDCFGELLPHEEGGEERKFNKGGKYVKIEEHIPSHEAGKDPVKVEVWEDRGGRALDFRTLLMNIILTKMTYCLDLETDFLMSYDGNSIHLLVHAPDDIVKKWGKKFQSTVRLELGKTDLISVEPCDDLLRKYRSLEMPDSLKDQIKAKELKIQSIFSEIDKQTGVDPSDSAAPMTFESKLTEQHWIFYMNWLDNVADGLQDVQECPKEMKDFLRQKMMCYAMQKANLDTIKQNPKFKKNNRLFNLWERAGYGVAMGAYVGYDLVREEKILKQYRNNLYGDRFMFNETDKLKIIHLMIESQIVIARLINKKYIRSYFPLHNNFYLWGHPNPMSLDNPHPKEEKKGKGNEKEEVVKEPDLVKEHPKSKFERVYENLREKMLPENKKEKIIGLRNKWKFHLKEFASVPGGPIQKYFGEKLALTLQLMAHYSRYCLVFSIVGIVYEIVLQGVIADQEVKAQPEYPYVICGAAYTIAIVVWCSIFFVHWKRKQVLSASTWGQLGFAEHEKIRAEFEGIIRRSPITDEVNEVYYPQYKKTLKIVVGIIITVGMIILSMLTVTVISFLKTYLIDITDGMFIQSWISTLLALVNALQIIIFNIIYEKVAIKMTNFENHRTQSQYETSLIVKTYTFQFINSYYSLFFIGFIKPECVGENADGETESNEDFSCIYELGTQLRAILFMAIISSIIKVVVPVLLGRVKARKLNKAHANLGNKEVEGLRNVVEKQAIRDDYAKGGLDGTYGEYLDMVVQMGYCVLFGFAFPAGIILATFNNLLVLQLNRYKLMDIIKRPLPAAACNIGIWQHIILLITYLGILTNVGMVTITLKQMDSSSTFTSFIGFVFLLMVIKAVIDIAIPDLPVNVKMVGRRHDKITERALAGMKIQPNLVEELEKEEALKHPPKYKVE